MRHTPIKILSVIFSDTYVYLAWNMRHASANRQWKVVDERDSGNIFTNDHWCFTHILRIIHVRTTQTTQQLRWTAQYGVNSYAKPSFELFKTWNRAQRGYGEHRRTTTHVPRQKHWWNAQIADASRNYFNFVRDSCVYANFGQCDRAFKSIVYNSVYKNLLNKSVFHTAMIGTL